LNSEITFCDACDASIPDSDISRGVAGHADGRLLCTLCYRGRRRRRLALFALAPLAVLTAAALGAATAVLTIGAETGELRGRIHDLEERVARGEAPDDGLVRELEGLAEVDLEQTRAIELIGRASARRAGALSEAVEEVSGHTAILAAELRAIKERLQTAAAAPADPPGAEPSNDMELLLSLIESEDWGARLSGVVGLSRIDGPRVVEILTGLLSDSSSNVRGEAASILGDRGDRGAIEPLIGLLADPNARVRKISHRSLEKILGEAIPYDPLASEEERSSVVKLLHARFGSD